jgi:N-acetylglucosamine-6-phosphate deacetylase
MSLLVTGGQGPDLLLEAGRIVAVGGDLHADSVLDASGLVVAPGFVDVQCNGAFGIDLAAEPERLWGLAALLPQAGVTTFLPTIVTSAPGVVERAQAALAARPADHRGADAPGLHLEGPMLAIAGAHAPGLLRSFDLADLTGVRLVTLAPELPGATEVIARLRAAGVVVAAGHTEAADLSGVDGVTHVFNAMAPLHHRAPGPAGLALADDRLFVTLVADGEHVHPAVAIVVARAAGERLVLVSDAVAGPTRRAGVLQGGAVLLDGAVRNLAVWTGSPELAIRAATEAPARYARLPDRGHLRIGARADLVLLTPALEVVTTVVAGEVVFSTSPVREGPRPAASGRSD